MAALSAAEAGACVLLLEGNEKLGKKIYITGKGRCNVTNACEPAAFMNKVVENPRFLFSALNAFGPEDMMALLERLGCPVKVERGDRVFPVSEKASDVTRTLEKELRRLGVSIRLNTKVSHILVENTAVCGVELEDGTRLEADRVVVATGGQSYPSTGSTGDGFRWMAELGAHGLSAAALPDRADLRRGVGFRPAGLEPEKRTTDPETGQESPLQRRGRDAFHPLRYCPGRWYCPRPPTWQSWPRRMWSYCWISKTGLTAEQLDARLLRELDASGKRQLHTLLTTLYPASLAETMPAPWHPRANARLRDHPGAARPAGQSGQRTASAGGTAPGL